MPGLMGKIADSNSVLATTKIKKTFGGSLTGRAVGFSLLKGYSDKDEKSNLSLRANKKYIIHVGLISVQHAGLIYVIKKIYADVIQLVECNFAKVDVMGSSPIICSI